MSQSLGLTPAPTPSPTSKSEAFLQVEPTKPNKKAKNENKDEDLTPVETNILVKTSPTSENYATPSIVHTIPVAPSAEIDKGIAEEVKSMGSNDSNNVEGRKAESGTLPTIDVNIHVENEKQQTLSSASFGKMDGHTEMTSNYLSQNVHIHITNASGDPRSDAV